jgi:hypothetical protein
VINQKKKDSIVVPLFVFIVINSVTMKVLSKITLNKLQGKGWTICLDMLTIMYEICLLRTMALKRFLIFTLINVVLTTMVFSAPTTRQSAVTTEQNQTTSSLGAVVNQSSAPAGLMMQAPRITGLEFQIRGLLLEHAKGAVNMVGRK